MSLFSIDWSAALTNEGIGKDKTPPLATHCDVPLKYNKQRAAILKPGINQVVRPNNRPRNEWIKIQEIFGPQHPDFFDMCHFQHYILNTWAPPSQDIVLAEMLQQIRVSEELNKLSFTALFDLASPPPDQKPLNLSPEERMFLQPYYFRKSWLEELVLASGSESYQPFAWIKKSDGVAYYQDLRVIAAATPNLFFLKTRGRAYLCSRDHLLCLSDLASQRYILIKKTLYDKSILSSSIACAELIEFFEIGDRILERGGNPTYELIYKMEPLVLSYLVGNLPVGKRQGLTFHALMLQEVSKVAQQLEVNELLTSMLTLLNQVYQKDETLLIELFGLYRIWGHPTIEPLEGTSALKKVATSIRRTNEREVHRITNKFKEEFIMRYIVKEHCWPNLDLEELPEHNILKVAYMRRAAYPIHHADYNRDDLTLVKFKQLFPIDPKFDLVELIADKALSLLTPELINKIVTQSNCGTALDRSVLLNWLKSPIQDPEIFLKYIDEHGFPLSERSVGVREKEREGKMKARLFGLMTLFKRMYIVLTEALLAEHLLPYFPEITMIDDELSLDKKRLQFTTKGNDDHIIISLDFSKWNSNMRKNETLPMFQAFDQMFGFQNCFARTHEMFETSHLYLLNGSYLPKVSGDSLVPDIGCWSGHLGGIEGLRQKGWTLWTISLILLAAEDLPFKLRLMGQGDNQVLKLSFPGNHDPVDCENIMYRFLSVLDGILATTGPPLKLEETWASRDIYVYGKYIIYKGVPIQMSMKRVARMMKLANEDYPTLESTLSSLAANLTSALAGSYQIGALFLLYIAEVVASLQLHFRGQHLQENAPSKVLSQGTKISIPGASHQTIEIDPLLQRSLFQSDEIYHSVCMLPRPLGGLPILSLFDCLLRGFPDEVSFCIASLRCLYPHTKGWLQARISSFLSPPLNKFRSFRLLLEHPTCLNLKIPPAPGESRRAVIIDFLKEQHIPLNHYVKSFLDRLDSDEENRLYEYLEHATHFNPRVLSMFINSTTEARARHVAGKLQKTKTIATVAREEGNKSIYRRIMDAEANHLASVLNIALGKTANSIPWDNSKCSTQHATDLRNIGWGKEIVGVSCVPPHEFMKLELTIKPERCLSSVDLSKGYVAIHLDPNYGSSKFSDPLEKGVYTPYRGSVTRQKVMGFGDKVSIQSDPLLQKVLKLFSLVGWGIPRDGNLHQIAIKLLNSKTDFEHALLCPLDEEITGSVHHRLQDMRTGHGGAVPVLPNYGTRFMFNTFPLSEYSKGSKNVNLMFQSFMSASVVILGELSSQEYKFKHPVVHMHVASSCCVSEISDEMVECNIPHHAINFTKVEDNPYLFIGKDRLKAIVETRLRFNINRTLPSDPGSLFHRFHSVFSEEVLHLLSPHSWDFAQSVYKLHQVVINWALATNVTTLLYYLALRFSAHYLGAYKRETPLEYLDRVAERIDRSPAERWRGLGSLIFAPNFHHHIVSAPVRSQVSGNPVCSDLSLGLMIRSAIVSILKSWSLAPNKLMNLSKLSFYSRPYCGLSQHPSLLILTRDFLCGNMSPDLLLSTRGVIMDLLSPSSRVCQNTVLRKSGLAYYKEGKRMITGETLDVLSKAPLPKIVPREISSTKHELPPGSYLIHEWTRKSLHQNSWDIFTTDEKRTKPSYVMHALKLATSPTTGTYKILSILNSLHLPDPNMACCLGDGSGGFTLGVGLLYPQTAIFYNSLVTREEPIQQCPPIPFLPSLAGRPQIETRVKGLDIVNEITSDLTDPDLSSLIRWRVSPQADLVCCDAETPEDHITKGIEIMEGVLKIATDLKTPCVVIKVYAKMPRLLGWQIGSALQFYQKVSLYRSHFSSRFNTELYMVASNPGKTQTNQKTGDRRYHGLYPSDESLKFLYELSDGLQRGCPTDIMGIFHSYSQFIQTDYTHNAINKFLKIFPCFSFRTLLIFPHSIVDWIISRSTPTVGKPPIFRVRLETSTLHPSYIKKWMLMLIIGFYLSHTYEWESQPEGIIDNGYLIWYRLLNRTWSLSLYRGEAPPDDSRSLRSYKISSFLTSGDKKVAHAMTGIGIIIGALLTCKNADPKKITTTCYPTQKFGESARDKAEHPWAFGNLQIGAHTREAETPLTTEEEVISRIPRVARRGRNPH